LAAAAAKRAKREAAYKESLGLRAERFEAKRLNKIHARELVRVYGNPERGPERGPLPEPPHGESTAVEPAQTVAAVHGTPDDPDRERPEMRCNHGVYWADCEYYGRVHKPAFDRSQYSYDGFERRGHRARVSACARAACAGLDVDGGW
jgi:hypothetical protein